MSGNIISHNLFINCGTDAWYSFMQGKAISITDYADVGGNTYEDNAFLDLGQTIYHRGTSCTPEEFNDRDGIGGDVISGNTSVPTDQGAGDINDYVIGTRAR